MTQADLFAVKARPGAVFSPCRTWRYQLERPAPGPGGTVLWVMLNPSVADETKSDPTIRKVVGFSTRWGFSRVVVVNLFALVATDPAELSRAVDRRRTVLDREHPDAPVDPVGPNNDAAIGSALRDTSLRQIVVAWGANGDQYPDRVARVLAILSPPCPTLGCVERGVQWVRRHHRNPNGGAPTRTGSAGLADPPCPTCNDRQRTRQVYALGWTQSCQPRHPLMLPYTTPLVPFFLEAPQDEDQPTKP